MMRVRVFLALWFLLWPVLVAAGTPPVCIDPGHPSETADGRWKGNGLREVDVCWDMALKLKTELDRRGIPSFLTKEKVDQFVSNRERAETANRAGAALLVRLHCDSGKRRGFAVYTPDRPGEVKGVQGPPADVIAASRTAGQRFHAALAAALEGQLPDGGHKRDFATSVGRRQGALTGSIFARVPAVLVEMCHLTNKQDADFLRSPEGSQRMARALADGIEACLKADPAEKRGSGNQAQAARP